MYLDVTLDYRIAPRRPPLAPVRRQGGNPSRRHLGPPHRPSLLSPPLPPWARPGKAWALPAAGGNSRLPARGSAARDANPRRGCGACRAPRRRGISGVRRQRHGQRSSDATDDDLMPSSLRPRKFRGKPQIPRDRAMAVLVHRPPLEGIAFGVFSG
jgi:hypothetical protein